MNINILLFEHITNTVEGILIAKEAWKMSQYDNGILIMVNSRSASDSSLLNRSGSWDGIFQDWWQDSQKAPTFKIFSPCLL